MTLELIFQQFQSLSPMHGLLFAHCDDVQDFFVALKQLPVGVEQHGLERSLAVIPWGIGHGKNRTGPNAGAATLLSVLARLPLKRLQ